jgi:hypothetical protein
VPFENDDGKRPSLGVIVSLLDLGNGNSRIIMDDVRSQNPVRETSWDFDVFYTHQTHDNGSLDDMTLSDDAYQCIGVALVARLLALNKRAK